MRRPTFWIPCAVLLVNLACDKAGPTEPQSQSGGNPYWLDQLIVQIQAEPVTIPPSAIYSYTYQGNTVYYRIARCCDIRSVLYDANGTVLCEPDGGIDSGGDGRCPDFLATRTNEALVFEDSRPEAH